MKVDRDSLRASIKASGRSARALSLDAGLGATAIKDILSGKSQDPGAGTLSAIAAQLDVDPASLLIRDSRTLAPPSRRPSLKYLRVRYRVQAGHWIEDDSLSQDFIGGSYPVVEDSRYAGFPQWLEEVVGDSINERIRPGAFAHVVDSIEIGYSPRDGDFVVIERRRDQGALRERSIKQVVATPEGVEFWPRSTNPKWSEKLAMNGGRFGVEIEIEVVALVIGVYDPI